MGWPSDPGQVDSSARGDGGVHSGCIFQDTRWRGKAQEQGEGLRDAPLGRVRGLRY